MEKTINRIFEYLDYKGIKHTRFEKKIGLSNGYLSTQLKRNAYSGEGVLLKIVDNCEDINLEWLLTGKGQMLKFPRMEEAKVVDHRLHLEELIKELKARIIDKNDIIEGLKRELTMLRGQEVK